MDLFSVKCTTCSARLSVRSTKAIGQIVNCPKCQSMVLVEAPPGWKPPAVNVTETATVNQAATETPPAGQPAVKPAPSGQSSGQTVRVPVAPQQPAESPVLGYVAIGLAGVALVVLVGMFSWMWNSTPPAKPLAVTVAEASAEPSATTAPTATATVAPTPAATTEPTAAPTVAATAVPAATVPPVGTAPPAGTVPPAATVPPANTAMDNRPPVEPFVPVRPLPPIPVGPGVPNLPALPAVGPPAVGEATAPALPAVPAIDVKARLAEKLLKVEFADLTLTAALDFVSQVSNVPVSIDLEGLTDVGALPSDTVSARLKDCSIEELLDTILAQKNLGFMVEQGQLRVTSRNREQNVFRDVSYDVSDLARKDPAAAAELGKLVQRFVAPGSWKSPNVALTQVNCILQIQHEQGVQQRITELLTKLRLARGLAVTDASLTERFPLATRTAQVQKALAPTLTANFRETPLADIVKYLERKSELNILVDSLALAKLGLSTESPATLSSTQAEPVGTALERLVEPLQLGLRAIDQNTLQITSLASLQEQPELELYDIEDLLVGTDANAFVARVKSVIEPTGWTPGMAIEYEPTARRLIVLQSQPVQAQLDDWLAVLRQPPAEKAAEKPANARGT